MKTLMVGVGQIVDELFSGRIMTPTVNVVAFHVAEVALGIGVIFWVLSTAWNYMVSSAKRLNDGEAGRFFDKVEILRGGFLLVCIFLYLPIVGSVVDFSEMLKNQLKPTTEMEAQIKEIRKTERMVELVPKDMTVMYAQYHNPSSNLSADEKKQLEYAFQSEYGLDITKSYEEVIKDYTPTLEKLDEEESTPGWNIVYAITHSGQFFTTSLINFLMGIIRAVIIVLAQGVCKALICLGPLAFAFAIIPAFKSKVEKWFGTLLNALCVFITLNILETVVYGNMASMLDMFSGNTWEYAMNVQASTITNCAMLILYLMAFWLTSKYVGSSDAGKVITKAVGIATAGVLLAASAGTGGAGAAAGGAGAARSAGNAASAAGAVNN